MRILSATVDERPRRIAVLLDASGSMLVSTKTKWELALQAAGESVVLAPPATALAFVMFAEKVEEKIGFTQGRKAIAEKMVALAPGPKAFGKGSRKTALWDAVLESLTLFDPPRLGDVIYVITDGGDNHSRNKPAAVERALRDAGVRLFAFLFDNGRTLTPEELAGLQGLVDVVRATGGDIVSVVSRGNSSHEVYMLSKEERSALGAFLRVAYREMSEFYRLDVELPRPVDKPREWKLDLVAPLGSKKQDFRFLYQRKLLPCGTASADH